MSNTIKDFVARLEKFLARTTHSTARVVRFRQLTGGASRDTWSVDVQLDGGPDGGTHGLILRRDMGGVIDDQALSRDHEFALLGLMHAAGVKVPQPRWLCSTPDVLDAPFFLMDRLEGESVGRRVVREPALSEGRKKLPKQMGDQLARIHDLDPATAPFLPCPAPGLTPAHAILERTSRQLERLGEPHPALELGLRWLRAHLPPCPELVVVHGDFRVGNLMVGPSGLVGVFDWEFSHVGDPAEDLAWPLVRSWRFGQDNLRLGGVGQPEEFFRTYEEVSGRTVSLESVRFWEVFGNFRWAVGCIQQANRHLSGQTTSLELVSLGRRAAEMELELLDLIDRIEGGKA